MDSPKDWNCRSGSGIFKQLDLVDVHVDFEVGHCPRLRLHLFGYIVNLVPRVITRVLHE